MFFNENDRIVIQRQENNTNNTNNLYQNLMQFKVT